MLRELEDLEVEHEQQTSRAQTLKQRTEGLEMQLLQLRAAKDRSVVVLRCVVLCCLLLLL